MQENVNSERPSLGSRLLAKGIDLGIVFVIGLIFPAWFTAIVGFAYTLLADGFDFNGFHAQSVGKKLIGLQVFNRVRMGPANYRDSIIRNSPVAFAVLFAMIPILGWILLVLLGIPLILTEIYLMYRIESGQRLGDVMADSEVRYFSEPAV